jgi:secretion-regulating guanine nucleotide exchange factor
MTKCVWVFGSNASGQLGTSDYLDRWEPTPVYITEIPTPIQIDGGANHTLILSSTGEVYGCGDNSKGQLGLSEPSYSRFQKLEMNQIRYLSCGWDSSFVVNQQGDLWAVGSNSFGVCGISKEIKSTFEWIKVNIQYPIKKVASGPRHSLFLCENGILYGSGSCKQGVLGAQDIETAYSPVQVSDDIIDISCGQFHSVAINKQGDILAFGRNKFGQLALPLTHKFSFTAQRISNFNGNASRVFCGWSHCSVLLENGELFMWGRGDHGQLGRIVSDGNSYIPALTLCDVLDFACGSEHCLALTTDGKAFSWGWNEHGNCGTNTSGTLISPFEILTEHKVSIIGTGAGHTIFY